MAKHERLIRFAGAVGSFLWLLAAGPAFCEELVVEAYRLTEKPAESVNVDCVRDTTSLFSDWLDKASASNPVMSSKIKARKIATLEIKVPNFDDLGSMDPFVLAGRRRAAKLGANVLSFENGVKNKVTHRISRVTYTAYEVRYGEHLIPGFLLDRLASPIKNSQEFEDELAKESAACVSQGASSNPEPSTR